MNSIVKGYFGYMEHCKLQLGCLLVVLFTLVVYVKRTTKGNIPCNRYYDTLLVICPWAIIFDGITAVTVNHLDTVPPILNLILHGLFFVLDDLAMIIAYVYTINLTLGMNQSRRRKIVMYAPGAVCIAMVLGFLPQLHYRQGEVTNYSWGVSAIASYACVLIHMLLVLGMTFWKRKNIEKNKMINMLIFMNIIMIGLVAQVFFPEILITAIFPTLLVVGLYISAEDPFIRRLQIYNEVIVTDFATLVENRDNSTGGHVKRTKNYVELILNEMQKKPEYRRLLTKDYVDNVINAAPMHDIGKIGIPDQILQKPGKLTAEEFEVMKTHTLNGGDIIKQTFSNLNEPEFERICYEVACYHHEKWNGTGYPAGLVGEDIPLHARIMAIADVFDAVSAKRCYRDALPIEECFRIIEDGIGTEFDPELAKLFLHARGKVFSIYKENRNEN